MPSYPPVLTEEQMQDAMDLAGFQYSVVEHPELVQKMIQIPIANGVYIKDISEFESAIPHAFEGFIDLKKKGLI